MFSQEAYDATKASKPGLWYRPTYFFDKECEASKRLSREKLLSVLSFDIKKLIQEAKANCELGATWGIGRLVFSFVGLLVSVGA